MKNRKRFKQREEVREILATMKLELAAQRLAEKHADKKESVLRVNEIFNNARKTVVG